MKKSLVLILALVVFIPSIAVARELTREEVVNIEQNVYRVLLKPGQKKSVAFGFCAFNTATNKVVSGKVLYKRAQGFTVPDSMKYKMITFGAHKKPKDFYIEYDGTLVYDDQYLDGKPEVFLKDYKEIINKVLFALQDGKINTQYVD